MSAPTDHSLDAWQFDLPHGQIAQAPAEPRDSARMLRIDRDSGQIAHFHVRDLPKLLPAGAVLVSNNTKVMAARLLATKRTGGKVELLLARPALTSPLTGHEALYKTSKKLRPGTELALQGGWRALVTAVHGGGRATIDLDGPGPLHELLDAHGAVPLPPYIRGGVEHEDGRDRRHYQCVYASQDGAVAAPTAGLHFTPELIAGLEREGVPMHHVTLHVGPGTFLPVRAEYLREHRVLPERFVLADATAAALDEAKAEGRPIIAVGTTTTRVLESCYVPSVGFKAGEGETDLTILPGHAFGAIDGLMTNFHLPCSSLLLLVGALVGRERILAAYQAAVRDGYRFYSYGDATLIL